MSSMFKFQDHFYSFEDIRMASACIRVLCIYSVRSEVYVAYRTLPSLNQNDLRPGFGTYRRWLEVRNR